MTQRTPEWEVEVRVILREGGYWRQTAFNSLPAATMQEAVFIFDRYAGAIEHLRKMIEAECKPEWAGERHLAEHEHA